MQNRIRNRRPNKPIKTTFMELLDQLSSITKDDALVIATVKSILGSYKVRFTHTLAPVRLVGGDETPRELRRAKLARRSSALA